MHNKSAEIRHRPQTCSSNILAGAVATSLSLKPTHAREKRHEKHALSCLASGSSTTPATLWHKRARTEGFFNISHAREKRHKKGLLPLALVPRSLYTRTHNETPAKPATQRGTPRCASAIQIVRPSESHR